LGHASFRAVFLCPSPSRLFVMSAESSDVGEAAPCLLKRQMSGMGVAFLEGTWPPDMNMLEPTINVLMWLNKKPDKTLLAQLIEEHLWPCHRFSCCMEDGGFWVQRQEKMDMSYHFPEVRLFDEVEVNTWVQSAMSERLSRSHPPWQVTLLTTMSTTARPALWMRVHHAVGDGLGLVFAMSPLLGCEDGDFISKVPLPRVMLPPSYQKTVKAPADTSSSKGKSAVPQKSCSCCGSAGSYLKGLSISAKAAHDSELSINATLEERQPYLKFNGRRHFQPFPVVSMELVSASRRVHDATVNDVMLAAITGAMRRYCAYVRGDEQLKDGQAAELEFKAMLMLGLPRNVDERDLTSALTNKMLFSSCALPIGEPTVEGRMDKTKAACEVLKSPAYIAGLHNFTEFVKNVAPKSFLRKAAGDTFSKHSLLITNIPTATVPLAFPKGGDAIIQEMQMVFPNIIPQVSILSYNGNINANLVADPALFPQPERLGQLWVSELEALAENS